jgi:hypothetical protein
MIVDLAHDLAVNLSPGILAAPASTREQRNFAVARASDGISQRLLARDDAGQVKADLPSMVWIQSIICSLLFAANFAWPAKHLAVAIALNVLLAMSCTVLLLKPSSGEDVDRTRGPSDELVRNIMIAGLILFYVGASVAKLNGSSTALWLGLADGRDPAADVIIGKPRDIRSDEWLVHTPWIWSQAEQQPSFPVTNRNIGNGVAPLLTNLPARHWSMLFRPQMWGFFFFGSRTSLRV